MSIWLMVLSIAAFAMIAAPVMPWTRVRYMALGLQYRLLQLAMLGLIGGCGYLYFRPAAVPGELAAMVEPMAAEVTSAFPHAPDGFLWMVMAAGMAAISLPVMALIDFAHRLTGHTAVIQSLATRQATAPATPAAAPQSASRGNGKKIRSRQQPEPKREQVEVPAAVERMAAPPPAPAAPVAAEPAAPAPTNRQTLFDVLNSRQ